MSKTDTLITIRLQANNTASVLITAGGIGKIGQVENYSQPSDLLPTIEKLLSELADLSLPDIETSAEDKVTFYGGYQSWQPSDTQWGFNEPSYTPPVSKTKSKKSKPKSKAKPAPVFKSPFTLHQDGKQRTLQLIDDFDVSLECKDNKSLKFDKQADAKRIAQVLATQDNQTIVIQDKSGQSITTIKPETVALAKI